MVSPVLLLSSAWRFYRKQPVLNHVLLWLLFLPLFGMRVMRQLMEPGPLNAWPVVTPSASSYLLISLASLVFGVVLTWGNACVLLIGKRLIKSPAGRSRTSFRAVRSQAFSFVIPLLLTNILRVLLTLLWSLLLIVPGIVFLVRSSFYSIALVCEKELYNASFKRSAEVMRGQVLHAIASLILLSILTFAPATIVSLLASSVLSALDLRFLAMADVIDAALMAFAALLFTLGSIRLYAQLRGGEVDEGLDADDTD